MKTVTAEYLEGIREGRAWIKQFGPQTPEEIQAHIDNLSRCISQKFSKPMSDMFKGELDFWINQQNKQEN